MVTGSECPGLIPLARGVWMTRRVGSASGQVRFSPNPARSCKGGIQVQTRRVFAHPAVLTAAGSRVADFVKGPLCT